MARGRYWTLEEDAMIRKAVAENRVPGIFKQLALWMGRTPAAVRKRAERIGVAVYVDRRLPFGRDNG